MACSPTGMKDKLIETLPGQSYMEKSEYTEQSIPVESKWTACYTLRIYIYIRIFSDRIEKILEAGTSIQEDFWLWKN